MMLCRGLQNASKEMLMVEATRTSSLYLPLAPPKMGYWLGRQAAPVGRGGMVSPTRAVWRYHKCGELVETLRLLRARIRA